jgi:hypothetical protein
VVLRALDAFFPPDMIRILQGEKVFSTSEKYGSDFVCLSGLDGLPGEVMPDGINGPGDFKSVFDPAFNKSINRFDGYGTSRGTGQR